MKKINDVVAAYMMPNGLTYVGVEGNRATDNSITLESPIFFKTNPYYVCLASTEKDHLKELYAENYEKGHSIKLYTQGSARLFVGKLEEIVGEE